MSALSLPLPDALRPAKLCTDALRPAKLCTDAQLARRAARGEQRAFAEIFERHHQAVYRYCRSIVRNEEDAADALQNTMAAVLRGLDGETREIALKPWLFRIAHNESLSLIRRRKPHSELHDDSPVAAAGGPEAQVLSSERLRQLVEDLQALPERQRGALVMRELSGLEYPEIAAAFGVGEGAARQAVYEAREMLHEIGEGRVMACGEVRELISARDGRLLRGRKVRAHLRACAGCQEFRAAIGQRSAALAAIAPPLPAVAGVSMLQGLLGGGGHSGGGLAVGGTSATTASVTAGSVTTAKPLAVAALVGKGSATAGIAAKAAAVLAVGATLTGGGVVAKQQLQREPAPSPAAAGAHTAPQSASARPTIETSAPAGGVDRLGPIGERATAAGGSGAASPSAASGARSADRSVDRRPMASLHPATQRPRGPVASPPAGNRASSTTPAMAQKPASTRPPARPAGARRVTAPVVGAPVQAPSPGSMPALADSTDTPVIAQPPLPKTSGR